MTIQLRRDTAANWTSGNPVLANGETGWESDTGQFKMGDGATAWNSLGYYTDTKLLDTTAADIQPLGTAAAGNAGLAADAKHVHPTTGIPLLNAQNTYTATQYFEPPTGDDTVANAFTGRSGGFSYGIDSAAAIPSRDWFLGRVEQVATGDDTDLFYIQHNAQTATLTSSVSAGATSLPVSAALTFTGDDGTGKYWVQIGDNTTGNIQEAVQITAGRGTTTMTCPALAHPHPSGALVTLGYDYASQSTFEFYRVGSAAASNANWRVTMRPDVTSHQPALGVLKMEIPPSGGLTADYFEVAARDESQKAFRIQADYSVTVETTPVDWTDSAGVTNSNTTIGLSITPSDQMYGCFITGTGITRGTYITGINAGAKTVTISTAATATATGVFLTIYKPLFQVRDNAGNGYKPHFSYVDSAAIFRGKVMLGSAGNAGAGIPNADLTVAGTSIYMNGGGSYPDFGIALDTAGGGQAHLQLWSTTGLTFGSSGGNTTLGFYTASPVTQPSTTGTTAGFTAGTGTTVVSGSTFTGNTGTAAYTIGDIVHALKIVGLLAS